MRDYKLIAFDMDGTLLNEKKEISKKNIEYINKAIDKGIIVILSTGRNLAELRDYLKLIPGIRYVVCTSGSYIGDLKENKVIYRNPLTPKEILPIMDVSEKEDIMVHFLDKDSIIQKDTLEVMEKYGMGDFKEIFRRITVKLDDIRNEYRANPVNIDKILMYHTNPEARERTKKRLEEKGLDLMFAYAWTTSLEVSPGDVDKGKGIKRLCDYLGIDIEDTIVVGDSDNDRGSFKVCGLKIAVENATDEIKEMADVIVASNDDDGCAQAIEQYLL